MKRALVIQGKSEYVSIMKEAWRGIDIIWSTWKGEENNYKKDDIVVYSEYPSDSGIQNVALQRKTTIAGIKKAKDLGYDRILKCRSDIVPTNSKNFLSLLDDTKINFLYWHTHGGGYFVDYLMEGDINDIEKMWSFESIHSKHAERLLTDQIFNKLGSKEFNFIGNKLVINNDLIWLKRKFNLSVYNDDNQYINYIKK